MNLETLSFFFFFFNHSPPPEISPFPLPAALPISMKRIPLAREGWPFVAVPAALAAGLFVPRRRRLALPFAAATLASLGFFRDPERRVPVMAGAEIGREHV